MMLYIRLFFTCVAVVIGPLCWAESDEHKSKALAQIRAKIRQVGRDVKELAEEKSVRIEELRRLEKEYGEKINALNAVKIEVEQQEQILKEVRDNVAATQKKLQLERRSLEALVKSAYAMGGRQGLDVLLNQRDPMLSGRMVVYYDYISKARLQKLQLIQENVETLKRLESQKDTETQLLQVALEKKQQEADALQVLKVQRENLLTQLNKDFTVKQEQLANLINDQKKLEALIASLRKADDDAEEKAPPVSVNENRALAVKDHSQTGIDRSPSRHSKAVTPRIAFSELQGNLPWPVGGKIVEHFGGRRFETKWDGTVIDAREGADIHAVADGRVVFADWLLGYGLIIIVDHGRGYMSLYAFNQSLHKSVGESVKAGDILASVGRSGGRSQAALYFGIRVKGRAVDPEKWCRRVGRG
ncbi:MAG: murein hydrolase activator EnvC family protein [Gammaproteobacteria bacterium]